MFDHTVLIMLPIYLILAAGILSHLLLFICFVKDPLKCFRNSATYLVMNLALSDFISCVSSSVQVIFAERLAVPFCTTITAMLASLLSIFSIAIDRYMLTAHPFKHRAFVNGKRIAIWIGLIWLISFCLLAKCLVLGVNQMTTKMGTIIYDAVFIIIALVTVLIYALTYFSLKKQQRGLSQHNRSRNRALQEEFVKTIMIVAFVQLLTLIPPSVYGVISAWQENSVIAMMILALYLLNFSINPFLYIWRLRNYRQTFRLIFCKKLC